LDLEIILLLCLGAFLLNLPFGYFRAGTVKFSWQWFTAIHLPVFLIIIMRILSGVSWHAIPFVFLADIAGQFAGGMLRPGVSEPQPAEEE
jgi:hypothetical protein